MEILDLEEEPLPDGDPDNVAIEPVSSLLGFFNEEE